MSNILAKLLVATALCASFSANALAEELTISAAASLTDAFTEMQKAFAALHPDLRINMNFGASNPLLRQIIAGAPVDVFASADPDTMNQAQEFIDPASRKNFAANSLVAIVPADAPAPATLAELAQLDRIAIGNPDSVPAGRYARAVLEKSGLWDELNPKFVYGSNVRQVLDYVARGEVNAGIVYGTDACHQAEKVKVAITLSGHEPILYPIAVVTTGNTPKAAYDFVEYVLSPAGQKILERYGFTSPQEQGF